MMRKILCFLLFLLVFWACKEPEARRPKQHSTTNFYKELVAQNRKLIERENKYIEAYIALDTLSKYIVSPNGFWYKYDIKIDEDLPNPEINNEVVFDFDIADLEGNIIYPKETKTYKVDKEEIISALQHGIKLMKKGETITFVIPSYSGFGIAGDGNKVGINQPIKSKVTLTDIKINNNEDN